MANVTSSNLIPLCILAKKRGVKLIYIESFARVRTESFKTLLDDVRHIIEKGLQEAYQGVDMVMVNVFNHLLLISPNPGMTVFQTKMTSQCGSPGTGSKYANFVVHFIAGWCR